MFKEILTRKTGSRNRQLDINGDLVNSLDPEIFLKEFLSEVFLGGSLQSVSLLPDNGLIR